MAPSGPPVDDTAEIIDASELLSADAYASLEPNALPDTPEAREHGLFLERLEHLMQVQEEALTAFADREQKPVDYIRRHVALAYSRLLFDRSFPEEAHGQAYELIGANHSARAVVAKVCSTLDSLHSAGQYESLLLVTSTRDGDKSFIGGTKIGKAFWDSLKMGGNSGVKMFKNHCKLAVASGETDSAALAAGKKCKNSLKSELNTAMRVALRNASGNSSAEMRWTKPEQIENWGVRIAGWPQDLPFRNPSNNTVQVNSRLLDLLKAGTIKFVKPGDPEWDGAAVAQSKAPKFATPKQQQHAQAQAAMQGVMSHVQLPPGVVLGVHPGALEHSAELMRHGAIFHQLPPGVSVLNGRGEPGMVALPISVAMPVLQQTAAAVAHQQPVASTSHTPQDASIPAPVPLPTDVQQQHHWSRPVTPGDRTSLPGSAEPSRSSSSDRPPSSSSLKRKRDGADDVAAQPPPAERDHTPMSAVPA
ncbi:hypothetical protein AURDEDRAFT_183536 [Auricularia subglabra TFB-10046 SS5]|nr:hypothetical protein AURDEDRAFT_183536 [Auricularia subglabra TFB-10046 SS5]